MMTTPIFRSTSGRARADRSAFASAPVVHSCATGHPIAPASPAFPVATATTTTTTTTMNLWLGGNGQTSSFDSKYATKRISPGRLEGMT
jgi:hypothetical protein